MPRIMRMTPIGRARNAALLCCHFARNFAYYSVFRKSPDIGKEGFWLTVQGNFIDVCVLEWCKLFGNRNGKYHWKNALCDPEQFRRELLEAHCIDEVALKNLWNVVKDYRDGFVAHTEEQETTEIPNMNLPHLLVEFYYRKLRLDFHALQTDKGLPAHFDRYYDSCLREATGVLQHTKTHVHDSKATT